MAPSISPEHLSGLCVGVIGNCFVFIQAPNLQLCGTVEALTIVKDQLYLQISNRIVGRAARFGALRIDYLIVPLRLWLQLCANEAGVPSVLVCNNDSVHIDGIVRVVVKKEPRPK